VALKWRFTTPPNQPHGARILITMRSRRSLPTIVVSLAVLAAVGGLLSNVVASDIWERIHCQPWYSPTGTGLVLCLIVAASIAILVHQDRTAKTKEETSTDALSPIDSMRTRSGK
jgi:membrane protein YdbS with pleckstrin-like domain